MSSSNIPVTPAGFRTHLLAAAGCLLAASTAAWLPPAFANEAREGEDANIVRNSTMSLETPSSANRYISTLTPDGQRDITAHFRSFDGDPLSVRFLVSPAVSQASVQEFGVSTAELDALLEACRNQPGCDQEQFDRHTTRYYQQHALRLSSTRGQVPRLHIDVPQVVVRNRLRVKPVAAALRQLAAERGYGTEWMIEAAIALVQDGLTYRQPSTWENGRKILGFYPPPRALERGYGDCDTKAALLAAILQNLTQTRLVGVHFQRHYLLGMAGIPREDQAFIMHGGKPFVLVEAAGPARRRPGEVAPATQTALASREVLRIDPMF